MIVVTILGVMAATLQVASPHSVLVMLACVCGILTWATVTSFFTVGLPRRVFTAAAVAGIAYLVCYVLTDTAIEAWINGVAFAPFAWMKAGESGPISNADLRRLASSVEFQYFQQKVHLMLALVVGCIVGWFASS